VTASGEPPRSPHYTPSKDDQAALEEALAGGEAVR